MIFGGLVVGGVWAKRSAVIGLGPARATIAAAIMSSRFIVSWATANRYVDFNRTISILRFGYHRNSHSISLP